MTLDQEVDEPEQKPEKEIVYKIELSLYYKDKPVIKNLVITNKPEELYKNNHSK